MMRLGRTGRELLRWGRGGPPAAAPRRGAEVLVGAAGGESSGECGAPRLQPGVRGDRRGPGLGPGARLAPAPRGVRGAGLVPEPVFWCCKEGAC